MPHTSFCPSSGYLTNALPEGDKSVDWGVVREYEDFFIKAKRWGAFEGSDIDGNSLGRNVDGTVPDFVAEFERKLDGKPGLAPDMCVFPLITLLMLMGQCRCITLTMVSAMLKRILGLSREGPPKRCHQRNLPLKIPPPAQLTPPSFQIPSRLIFPV